MSGTIAHGRKEKHWRKWAMPRLEQGEEGGTRSIIRHTKRDEFNVRWSFISCISHLSSIRELKAVYRELPCSFLSRYKPSTCSASTNAAVPHGLRQCHSGLVHMSAHILLVYDPTFTSSNFTPPPQTCQF